MGTRTFIGTMMLALVVAYARMFARPGLDVSDESVKISRMDWVLLNARVDLLTDAFTIFAALARAAMPGRLVETRMVAIPGETLLSLWERSEVRRVLRSAKWY